MAVEIGQSHPNNDYLEAKYGEAVTMLPIASFDTEEDALKMRSLMCSNMRPDVWGFPELSQARDRLEAFAYIGRKIEFFYRKMKNVSSDL